jgi:fucose permease
MAESTRSHVRRRAAAARVAERIRRRVGVDLATVGRSRIAAAAYFFLTGLVFGTWAGRIPAFKHDLLLTDGQLSLAFLGMEAGAVIGLQVGGRFVPRIHSRRALVLSMPAFSLALAALGFVPDLATMCVVLFVMAGANSVVDVGINASGVAVQHLAGRSVMSRMHAMHSVGGVAGTLIGAFTAHLGVGRSGHFLVMGVLVAVAASVTSRWLLPAQVEDRVDREASDLVTAGAQRRAGWLHGWSRSLVLIGAIAFCLTFAEGAANDWTAVYVHDSLGMSSGGAALATAIFLVAMAVGRFFGDPVLARFGPLFVYRVAAVVAAVGFCAALVINSPVPGLVGLFLLGLGLSVGLPVTISAAGTVPRLSTATAVARVSTMAYLGSFVAPAVIGGIASATTLPLALGMLGVLLLVTLPVSGILSRATPESRVDV